VLGILAFAHGPIEARDLLDLRQLLLQSPSPLTTETLLRPLRRFVIGDGSSGHGYVLSHLAARATDIRACFVSWGKAILTRLNGDPDHASAQSEYA